jgi:hypothetical protein
MHGTPSGRAPKALCATKCFSFCVDAITSADAARASALDDEQQAEPTSDPALALPAKQQPVGLGSNQ